MTLSHSSRVSRQVLRLLDDPQADLSRLTQEDLAQFGAEIHNFLEDVWWQVGDTEFNRSGLRNATDKLIDHLQTQGYYSNIR